ncbi:sn-1-specific diacylglycerol lipase ABHD11-like isoform X2 [Leptinotarsa decemlineata]|uniref:sn-1-specific diacylglycerol lipase ABHD11 isoform X2 n=1 Tax=Leptinotarsa decemlineata TaxID=7539 RepID=UPI003D3082A2
MFSRNINLILSKRTHQIFRNVSSSEALEPVKMAYATYESTGLDIINQASPLLIMHGLFGSKSNWNSLCKAYHQKFDPTRKIIAMDARNHGDSPHSENHTYTYLANDIKALFDQLNLKKGALMGHSMGGRAVMLFALKYPELVERLVVVDISPVRTSPSMDSMPHLFQILESIILPSEMPMSKARTFVEEQLAKHIHDKSLRSFLLTNLVQKNNGSYNWRINIPVLLKNFNNIANFPVVDDLHYDGPVLFIAGGNSDYIQKSDYPKILKLFPNAELKFIEGAGHWIHSEKPAEFLKVTIDFLNKKINK